MRDVQPKCQFDRHGAENRAVVEGVHTLERLLHASLVSYVRNCYQVLKDECDFSSATPSLCAHVISCDATNATVWQQTKLHNLKAHSFYPCCELDRPFADICDNMEVVSLVADIKPLSEGTSAEYLHGTIVEQLRGMGTPTWRDDDLVNFAAHIHAWIFNTDAGGDISSCRRQIEREVADLDHMLMLGVDCMQHQYHLMVRSGLSVVEHFAKHVFGLDPGYWPRLRSIMHVWREKARNIYELLRHKDIASASAAAKLPPRALIGRWGSISACEAYILLSGMCEKAVRQALLEASG